MQNLIKKIFSICVFFVVLLLFLSSCNNKKSNEFDIFFKKKIIFGVEIFPPFCYLDKNKNLVGFDVDLAKLILKELDPNGLISLEFKLMNISELMAALDAKMLDLAPNFIKTKERSEHFLFSQNYIKAEIAFLIKNKYKNINNLADAEKNNLIFGIRPGSFEDLYLKKFYPNIKVINYNELPVIFQAFKTSKIDSLIMYKYVINGYILQNDIKNTKLIKIDYDSDELNFAFMFNKNNLYLSKKIDDIIKKLKENGELSKLKEKYNL